jgi:hypothetical protein
VSQVLPPIGPQVFDVGTLAVITIRRPTGVPVDLTSFVQATMRILMPSKAPQTWALAVHGAPINGQVEHLIVAGELPEAGEYRAQILVSYSAAKTWRTKIFTFVVEDNL